MALAKVKLSVQLFYFFRKGRFGKVNKNGSRAGIKEGGKKAAEDALIELKTCCAKYCREMFFVGFFFFLYF